MPILTKFERVYCMANHLLVPVFKSVFERDFEVNKFTDRLEMQKMVYLLQNMGISVGNYNFMWYKHGPYSQALQGDMLNLQSSEEINVIFSIDAKRVIDDLKNAIFKNGISYSEEQWVECLGSLYYIRENLLSSASSDIQVINELMSRKPHLNNSIDNEEALKTIKELFS